MSPLNIHKTLLIGTLAMISTQVIAQGLCGVRDDIEADQITGKLHVKFSDRVSRKVTAVRNNSDIDMELKGKTILSTAKNIIAVEGQMDDVIYITESNTTGCVIRAGSLNGKNGIYVERHEHIMNSPPKLEKMFIHAR